MDLATKNKRLEEELTDLKEKVRNQESLIISLQKERIIGREFASASYGVQPGAGRVAIFRTCRETHAGDPSLASGMYWIDPDGQGVGDDPIYVYCNMATGMQKM